MLTYLPENEDLTNNARKRNLKFVSDLWMHFRSKKNCGPPLCDTVIITIPPSICDYVVVIHGQLFTVILERGLISKFPKLWTFCVLLVTAVKDLFSGRLPGRSQDLGTFFNFHICNSRPCHFRVGDILIFNLDQMIFSLWSILLYYWQNIITCGFLSFFQANKGVCGF